MDADGLDVGALERVLLRDAVALVYVVPVHANPTGACLSEARRRHLVHLARAHRFTIVADEVYLQLEFARDGSEAPGPGVGASLRALDARGESVVSVGSLSKVFAPGLRVGWVVAGPETLARLRADACLSSGGGIAPLGCAAARSLLVSGELEAARAQTRVGLAQGRTALVDALERHLRPLGATFDVPRGGYFVWVSVPGIDAEALLPRARDAHGVGFLPGVRCRAADVLCAGGDHAAPLSDCLRLCFAFYSTAELELGVARLAGAVREYLAIEK